MRFKKAIRHTIALLSIFFLSVVGSLIIWTAIFSFSLQGTTNVIMSGSMEPGVSVGDIVISQEMSEEDLSNKINPGHVLVFKDSSDEERLITHRVSEKIVDETGSLDYFITKGDANRTDDSNPVYPDDIAGVARILIPAIGLPIQGLKTGNFIPAIVFFFLVSFAFIITREEIHHVRSENPKKDVSRTKRKGKHAKTSMFGKTKKHVSNAVTLLSIVTIITSSSIVISSSDAAFASSTVNTGCTFTSAETFGTTNPGESSDYVKGEDASAYCWDDWSLPTSKNFNIPLVTPGTNDVIGEASFTTTYSSNKYGFDWKLTLPPTHPINQWDTIRITLEDAHGQFLQTSVWLDYRSYSGHAGLYAGSDVRISVDIYSADGVHTHTGEIPIRKCEPISIHSLGAHPAQFCSSKALVNQSFYLNLYDASGAGRTPTPVQVILKYTTATSISYTVNFPNGTNSNGLTMTATNAAGVSASSTIDFVSPQSSGTINLDTTGSNVSFKIDTTTGNARKPTPDWTGDFMVNICNPSTWSESAS